VVIYEEGGLRVTRQSWVFGEKRYPVAELRDAKVERGPYMRLGRQALVLAGLVVVGAVVAYLLLDELGPARWPIYLSVAALLVLAGVCYSRPRDYRLTARRGPVRVVLVATRSKEDVDLALQAYQEARRPPPSNRFDEGYDEGYDEE